MTNLIVRAAQSLSKRGKKGGKKLGNQHPHGDCMSQGAPHKAAHDLVEGPMNKNQTKNREKSRKKGLKRGFWSQQFEQDSSSVSTFIASKTVKESVGITQKYNLLFLGIRIIGVTKASVQIRRCKEPLKKRRETEQKDRTTPKTTGEQQYGSNYRVTIDTSMFYTNKMILYATVCDIMSNSWFLVRVITPATPTLRIEFTRHNHSNLFFQPGSEPDWQRKFYIIEKSLETSKKEISADTSSRQEFRKFEIFTESTESKEHYLNSEKVQRIHCLQFISNKTVATSYIFSENEQNGSTSPKKG